MTAFESGVLTFFMAVGTLAMKTTAPWLLRMFGFRTVLLGDYAFGGAAILALAFFTPATPFVLMAALLFASGLFRSLGYTAVNTLSYADIPPPRMSRASSFAGTVDRVSVAAGVSSGAILLQLLTSGAGAPGTGTFQAAFAAVAGLMVLALLPCLQLARDAGSELSGRAVPRERKSES
jgi:MFS family permease